MSVSLQERYWQHIMKILIILISFLGVHGGLLDGLVSPVRDNVHDLNENLENTLDNKEGSVFINTLVGALESGAKDLVTELDDLVKEEKVTDKKDEVDKPKGNETKVDKNKDGEAKPKTETTTVKSDPVSTEINNKTNSPTEPENIDEKDKKKVAKRNVYEVENNAAEDCLNYLKRNGICIEYSVPASIFVECPENFYFRYTDDSYQPFEE